jgi:spermidine synthase
MIQQSSSPIHAKEAFLCIGRTLDSSGLVSIPTHDNVPSFGEWGWWIAGRDDRFSKRKLTAMMKSVTKLPGEMRYLTPELVHSSLVFGKEQLYTNEKHINSLSNTRVYDYYLKAWHDSF